MFEFYDKCQFPKGMSLCRDVFHDSVAGFKLDNETGLSFQVVDHLVGVAVLLDRAPDNSRARATLSICVKRLRGILRRSCLTKTQMNKLVPPIVKEPKLHRVLGVTEGEVRCPLF